MANIDDDGDTILQTFLDLVTEMVETMTDGVETSLDTVTDLLQSLLHLLGEHDESIFDFINGPTEDVTHEVESTGNQVGSFVDGDTDGSTNDDGDGQSEFDNLEGGIDGEVEDIFGQVQVRQVHSPETSALEFRFQDVDFVLDPTTTHLAVILGVEDTSDDQDFLTITDQSGDFDQTKSTLLTTGHQSMTDQVHDVMVDFQSFLITTMSGGVHASTEVDRVEVATDTDLSTDGETGVGTVAEGEIELSTGGHLNGQGTDLALGLVAEACGVLDLEDDDGFEVLEDEADGGLWFLRGLRGGHRFLGTHPVGR